MLGCLIKIANSITSWWDKRNRQYDIDDFWPICRELTDINRARAAFYLHASHDPAWTKYYSEDDLKRFVDNLR